MYVFPLIVVHSFTLYMMLCAVFPKMCEETMVHCPSKTSTTSYPVPLSPSPSPLSSPSLYIPPPSGDTANINKWREIARKLSLHSQLRNIWNQLKGSGGFSTNEHFIRHLLQCEADRQCVQYDVLSVEVPGDNSVVITEDNGLLVNIPDSVHVSEDQTTVCSVPFEHMIEFDNHTRLKDDKEKEEDSGVYQQPKGQCELTVLDSKKQLTLDDSGMYWVYCFCGILQYCMISGNAW